MKQRNGRGRKSTLPSSSREIGRTMSVHATSSGESTSQHQAIKALQFEAVTIWQLQREREAREHAIRITREIQQAEEWRHWKQNERAVRAKQAIAEAAFRESAEALESALRQRRVLKEVEAAVSIQRYARGWLCRRVAVPPAIGPSFSDLSATKHQSSVPSKSVLATADEAFNRIADVLRNRQYYRFGLSARRIRRAFHGFDPQDSGLMDSQTFVSALQRLELDLTAEQSHQVASCFCATEGWVRYPDFLRKIDQMRRAVYPSSSMPTTTKTSMTAITPSHEMHHQLLYEVRTLNSKLIAIPVAFYGGSLMIEYILIRCLLH